MVGSLRCGTVATANFYSIYQVQDGPLLATLANTCDVVQCVSPCWAQRPCSYPTPTNPPPLSPSPRSVLVVVFEIATVMIILLIFRVQVGTLWVSLTSPILAFTFIFGNTLKTMFETLVIMFGPHPFDVEDKLVVPGIGWCNVLEVTLVRDEGR